MSYIITACCDWPDCKAQADVPTQTYFRTMNGRGPKPEGWQDVHDTSEKDTWHLLCLDHRTDKVAPDPGPPGEQVNVAWGCIGLEEQAELDADTKNPEFKVVNAVAEGLVVYAVYDDGRIFVSPELESTQCAVSSVEQQLRLHIQPDKQVRWFGWRQVAEDEL